MELDDDGGFSPFGFDVTEETRELDENVDERNSCSQRRR
jgi:hypothetical protein